MANNLTFNNGSLNINNITEYPNSFKRQGAFPLERFSVFGTYEALLDYAQNNPIAYVGQQLVWVNSDTNEATVYVIQKASGDDMLAEVGKATAGDDKSISLSEDGILSLKNFGKKYYAFNAGTKTYNETPTSGWKAGLQPKVINVGTTDFPSYEIAWYEPGVSAEDLSDEVVKIKADIGYSDAADHTKLVDRVSTLESGKADKATTLAGYDITDAYTKTQTDTQIDTKISALGTVFEFKGTKTLDEFTALDVNSYEQGDVVLVAIPDSSGDNIYKEYVVVQNGSDKKFEILGDPSGVTALTNTVNALSDRVGGIDDAAAKLAANNTFSGDNTFSKPVKVETPTAETHATTKKYVDTADSALSSRIDGLESSVGTDNTSGLRKDVADLKTTVGDESKGLVKDVATNTSNIAAINNKLNTIEENAQVNKIESITVTGAGSTTVSITDKVATIALDKADKAKDADKVVNKLTLFGKEYDGSTAVTVTADTDIGVGTNSKLGLVKSSTGVDNVSINAEGIMSVSKVTNATNADNATTAETANKVAHTLTFGSETYDGSAPKEITLTGLGFNSADYATAAQGTKADSAVQSISIAGKSATVVDGAATISTADLTTGLGLGTASKKDETYFATAEQLTSLDEAVAKTAADNTFSGSNTFSKPVTVATPTAEGHAATKKYVDDNISTKIAAVDSMRFCGLLGGEGNITELPSKNVKNGDTYKVSVAGTYNNQAAKAGDMFIALVTTGSSGATIAWQYIPSADDGNVSAAKSLTINQLIVGNDNKDVKTLAAGENGQVLKMVNGEPAWSAESLTDVTSTGGTLERTKTGTVVNLEVAKVNVDKLEQTENTYIILNCGSSTVNI